MIDPAALRDDVEATAVALARRGVSRADVQRLADLDADRRERIAAVDRARADQKVASKAIGSASPDDRPKLIEDASRLKQAVADLEVQLDAAERAFEDAIITLPNLPHPDAPDGQEGDGVVLRTVGDRPTFDGFDPRDHVDLLVAAGALDLERGAKVSGARFAYLLGDAVRLEFALVQWAMAVAARNGHVPVMVPTLVRREAMFGTGFLPTDEQQLFRTDDRDDLYLVGTSEVPLAGLHMDEIVDPPLRYVGYSPCYRREAGSHGKDTRGILRVHQFEKVELFSFVRPEDSGEEHERLLAIEEEIFTGLDLHYQVVDIPVGDLGSSAVRKFDIEAWMPGQGAFREVTSTSNTTDYQARRLKCRYRTEDGSTALVHTLNGTAVALQRAIIAVVETHQQADGTVAVPDVLRPYLGVDVLFAG